MNIKRKCQVLMLPTDKHAAIVQESFLRNKRFILGRTLNIGDIGYHLYITSDEDIKEGDWCLVVKSHKDLLKDDIFQYNGECSINHEYIKKIIATTNTSLYTEKESWFSSVKSFGDNKVKLQLPKPSQQFIKEYIKELNKEYNKSDVISDVLVEYTYDNGEIFVPMNTLYLLVNSDNTINIKPTKNYWSKEDVVTLLYKSRFHKDSSDEKFDKWIEQNT